MRSYRTKKLYSKKLSILLVFGILLSGMTAINILLTQKNVEPSSLAAGPTCNSLCVTEPPCCAQIIAKMNQLGGPSAILDLPDNEQPYHECPGLYTANNERGYCRPSTCDQLPSGLAYRGRCGWYWSYHDGNTNTPEGYGCMIGSSEQTMVPICGGGPRPTSPPVPTTSLTPTRRPQPTNVIPSATPFYPPATATPFYIAATATPAPYATQAPSRGPVIIYITATPAPWQIQHPNYQNGSISPTPGNAWGATLQNTLVQAQNWWSTVLQKISEFTTTIAP